MWWWPFIFQKCIVITHPPTTLLYFATAIFARWGCSYFTEKGAYLMQALRNLTELTLFPCFLCWTSNYSTIGWESSNKRDPPKKVFSSSSVAVLFWIAFRGRLEFFTFGKKSWVFKGISLEHFLCFGSWKNKFNKILALGELHKN